MRSAKPQKNANESATWSAPPTIAMARIFQRSLNENSRPMVKSRRMMPSSARFATWSCPLMMENPYGPTIAPVRMKATSGRHPDPVEDHPDKKRNGKDDQDICDQGDIHGGLLLISMRIPFLKKDMGYGRI